MDKKDEILEIDQQWQTYHEKLLERCFEGTDNYEWSRLAKLPLKVINILQPMTWRMRDAEEAARILIDITIVLYEYDGLVTIQPI